jgi:hypothetical protein
MFAMLKFEKTKMKERVRTFGSVLRPYSAFCFPFFLFPFAFFLSSCRRDMQVQPKSLAYRESTFFHDGISSRPPVAGTVPRGYLRDDTVLYSGKKPGAAGAQTGQTTPEQTSQPIGGQQKMVQGRQSTTGAPANPAAMYPDDTDEFPFMVTMEVLNRGQERYQIFCSVCHGMTGNGDGIVARRGFNQPRPASYHQDRLRQAPVGHFFDVVTNGWGAMPSYASQVPVNDRWAIIAYIRALQLSQMPDSGPAPGSSSRQGPVKEGGGAPPGGQPK